jgi:hypothetical protein
MSAIIEHFRVVRIPQIPYVPNDILSINHEPPTHYV